MRQRSASPLTRELTPTSAPAMVGLEHEYRVFRVDEKVDFRRVIHALELGQAHLDPADPNAYRRPSGVVITVDGQEAELAFPPTPVRPGFIDAVVTMAGGARLDLHGRLPREELVGYSTHLSVSVPDRIGDRVARLFLRTFAPALMLLMDRKDSPGLLVRPRPGRLELGGEFVTGPQLASALAFATGSVLACVEHELCAEHLPIRRIKGEVVPDDHRYGWFIGRHAFGGDLYRDGRRALLRSLNGEVLVAEQHVEECWAVARQHLTRVSSGSDCAAADAAVAGRQPLPCEQPLELNVAAERGPSPYGEILHSRRRCGFDLAPVMATWDTTVLLALAATGRKIFISVPRDYIHDFVDKLDAGALDEPIAVCLAARGLHPRLRRRSQVLRMGVYRSMAPRARLVAPERAAHSRASA